LRLQSRGIIILGELKERLSHESSTGIDNSGSQDGVGELFLNLVKGSVDAIRIGDVGANADSLATLRVDLLDEWLVALGLARQ
jgi:hypothetical protein